MAENSEFQPKIYFSPEPGGSGGGPEDFLAAGGKPEDLEGYLGSRERGVVEGYDAGRAIEALFARTSKKEALTEFARQYQFLNEETETFAELSSKWDISRPVGVLRDREAVMKVSFPRLINVGVALELDDETAKLVAEKLSTPSKEVSIEEVKESYGIPDESGGMGLGTMEVQGTILESFAEDDKKEQVDKRYRLISRQITRFGTKEERRAHTEAVRTTRQEIEVRHQIHENWHFYHFYREAIGKLSEMYFQSTPSAEAIDLILNLPFNKDEKQESLAGVKFRNFGDKVEMAMRLYYINSICQKPERLTQLMETPGWKIIFPDDNLIKDWIGEPGKWLPEAYKDPGAAEPNALKETPLGSIRSKETLKQENGFYKVVELPDGTTREYTEADDKRIKDGRWEDGTDGIIRKEQEHFSEKDVRGFLTRRNMFAQSNPTDANIHEAIQRFLGFRGGEDANETDNLAAQSAQSLAYRLFKLWLIADNEGYEIYRQEDKTKAPAELGIFEGKELEFQNGPASSDFSKLTYPSLYNLKNRRRKLTSATSRDYGPKGSFGKVPRLTTDMLRMTTSKVENGAGGANTLSFYEQWWGYEADPENNLPRVEARRLGQLPWTKLETTVDAKTAEILELPIRGVGEEVTTPLYLSVFMAGWDGAPGRSYPTVLKTTFSGGLKDLEDFQFWLKFNKALDVGVRDGVAVNGVFRGLTSEVVEKKRAEHIQTVINVFWEGVASTEEYAEADDKMTTAGRGTLSDAAITQVEKIRRVAAKADIKLPSLEPTYKLGKKG